METEIEWLNKQLKQAECFVNIPKNSEEQKRIIKIYIKMFSDRLKKLEEWEKKHIMFCDRCEKDVDVNTHPCFSNPIKYQIREIIKSKDKDGGISINDVYYNLSLCACNKGITEDEVKENINDLVNNGEVYYCKPNVLRWLE